MSSRIFLLLIRDPTLLQAGNNPAQITLVRVLQALKDIVRGDSLEIPGCINVLSVAHRVGYFKTKNEKQLLNQANGVVDVLADNAPDPTVPAYDAQANKWGDIMTQAGGLPAFAPDANNSRMYRKARSRRREIDVARNQLIVRQVNAAKAAFDARQRVRRMERGNQNVTALNVLQDQYNELVQAVNNANQEDVEALTLRRDAASQALQHREQAIAPFRQLYNQLHEKAQRLQNDLDNSQGQHDRDMRNALQLWNYRDYIAKTYLERQGMLMGTPNELPIHGNFYFKKRTDTATPQLALGCSQQQNFPLALFMFIRRIGPGLGGIRNPYLVAGLGGVKIAHWEMEGVDEENVALSYRNIAYGSLDTMADTNMPNPVSPGSTRWFDRMNFHGSEGGWAAVMMAVVQTIFAGYGGAALAAGGDL